MEWYNFLRQSDASLLPLLLLLPTASLSLPLSLFTVLHSLSPAGEGVPGTGVQQGQHTLLLLLPLPLPLLLLNQDFLIFSIIFFYTFYLYKSAAKDAGKVDDAFLPAHVQQQPPPAVDLCRLECGGGDGIPARNPPVSVSESRLQLPHHTHTPLTDCTVIHLEFSEPPVSSLLAFHSLEEIRNISMI